MMYANEITLPDGITTLAEYTAGDLTRVRALHKASFAALAGDQHTPEQIAGHLEMIDTADYADDLAHSHLILAEDEDGLAATAGWLPLELDVGTARIRKVFVRPDRARQGLGRAMVHVAEAAAAEDGYRHFFVRANLNAVPLYCALGYRETARGEMPVAQGIVLPVAFMQRELHHLR